AMQGLLRALSLAEIEDERDRIPPRGLERRAPDQRRDSAAILPDVLLLVCRTPAGRSNLRRRACGRGVPLDGSHRGPTQPSREQVVPAIAEHVEKRVVGV